MIAALAMLAVTLAPAPALADLADPSAQSAEQQIRAQRQAFNGAIAKGDLAAITAVLGENAQIVTGRNSVVFSGRAAQIGMW
ncbi:MAG: hypothetical protein H0W71_05825 [Sphingomonas sp.]|nr:hypothetical protein [Sphingomonas sp.]